VLEGSTGQLDISYKGGLQVILSRAAESFPEKIAIWYGDQKFTYGELERFSIRFAVALANLGVKRGDMVAVFLFNCPQFVVAYFGVLKVGAVVTAVSPLYREWEVERQLCDAEAQTIIVLDSLYPIVEKIRDRTRLKNVIIVTGLDFHLSPTTPTPVVGVNGVGVLGFGELIKKDVVSDSRVDLQFNSNDDLAVLQYTGGTTGGSKGVMLSHSNLVSNVLSFASWIKGSSNDVFLTVLPFCHVYGMTTSMNVPISLGAEMVLLPKFNPIKSLQAIEKYRVTVFCGSPTMYTALLVKGDFEKHNLSLSSLRLCISGASSLPAQVQKQFMQITGCCLVEGYGLTEASPVTHCTPVNMPIKEGENKVGSIGVPLPDTEARIVDLETGYKTLPAGEIGELTVRGPQVMRGYWRKPKETAQVLREGWLFTGDVAYVDLEGYFYVVDRKKDLIKCKDYSIYPRELEDVLYKHPAVKFCAVIGKSDVLTGEVPKAFVVLKEDTKITEAEIAEFVNSKVADYKAIREIEFCKKLPTNDTTEKILKRTLK
jgi:long-chain acyl-CoA synthetase